MDMVNFVHARKAQALASDQDYRHLLHHYTTQSDDLRLMTAKKAYELQSEVMLQNPVISLQICDILRRTGHGVTLGDQGSCQILFSH